MVFLDVLLQSVIRYAKSVHFNKTNKWGQSNEVSN